MDSDATTTGTPVQRHKSAPPQGAPGGPSEGLEGVARQTALYGVGMVLGKLLGVVLLPVYTRFLTPADYGVMELVMMALDVIMIFAGAQLVQGIFRFYQKATSSEDRNAIVSTALIGLTVSFALAGGFLWLTAGSVSDLIFGTSQHGVIIRVAAATLAATPLIMVPQAYFRMRDRAGIFVAANLSKLVAGAAINVFLLLLGWGVLAIFVGNLVTTAIVGVWLLVPMVRETGLRLSPSALRDLTRYGLPLVATNVAGFVYTFGDRLFLQNAGGPAAVGLYMMAYQFGFLLITVGYGPFMKVWEPRRFRVAELEDRDRLLSRGFLYLNLMLLPLATGMVLFIEDFFRVMTTPAFYPAAQFVPVIVCAYVLQAWANIQDIGILVKERTGFLTLANWVAAAVAVVGYALLIPHLLAWGAALATLLAFAIRYALIFWISQRLWPVVYEWGPFLKLLGIASATGVVGWLLPSMPLVHSILVRGAIYAAFLAAVWRSGTLSSSERRHVVQRLATVAGVAKKSLRRN